MIVENINNSGTRLRILVAPLDWGLGHATRCIPIIRALIEHNADVVLAAEGNVVILLQEEFPNLKILDLKGYKVKYSRRKSLFSLKILMQLPKIFSAIRHEKNWLNKIVAEEKIDAIISDNRFGLYHNRIPCAYITHQLCIQTGNAMLNKIVQEMHYHYINKFDTCWIPDNKNGNDLCGALSHPSIFPRTHIDYIGILSRCKKIVVTKKYDFLLLISGPEPQRSIFESMLLKEFEGSSFSFVLLRGTPGNSGELKLKNSKAKVFNHLPGDDLNILIQESETVIARSGYSTIMDLARLQQKAVLIPTPGQTEQEYLAGYLMEKHMFYCVDQEEFSLKDVIEIMRSWEHDFSNFNTEMNEDVINKWLQSINYSKF